MVGELSAARQAVASAALAPGSMKTSGSQSTPELLREPSLKMVMRSIAIIVTKQQRTLFHQPPTVSAIGD